MKTITSTCKLNNGVEMPIFGLGLYRSKSGKETEQAVQWAHETGYIMYDTAQIYGNEQDLGNALKQLEVNRQEIWITTKIWRENMGTNLIETFEQSLKNLQTDYIDLLLIHWPNKEHRLSAWDQMVSLLNEGKVKALGVSNYMAWHLEELLKRSSVVPQVNQCEASPYLYDPKLIELCRKHNIQFEAYSPLTKGQKLKDQKLVKLAKKYSKTPAQILIRWGLEHDMIEIPKSVSKNRIIENSQVFNFSLSKEDLDEMNTWNIDLVTGWNPRNQD